MKNQVKTFILGGVITLILGIGLIIGGIVFLKSSENKRDTWVQTYAQVVAVRSETQKSGNEYKLVYIATVEYNVDGVAYRNTVTENSRIPPTIGTSREILYNPDNPQESIFQVYTSPVFPIAVCIAGGVFIFAALLCFVTYGRKK